MQSSPALIYVKLLLTATFWGGTFVAGRMLSGHISPCCAAFLRFTLAALLLNAVLWRTGEPYPHIRRSQLLPVTLLGLTGIFSYNILFFNGLTHIQAGRAALIIALNPIMITLFSTLLFRERLRIPQAAGIVMSVCGALVVVTRGDIGQIWHQGIGTGEWMIFGCVLSWTAFSLIGKTVLSSLSPLVSITYAATIGALLLLVPAWMEGLPHQISGYGVGEWLNIFYLGFFGTVLGFIWYYQGIRAIGPSRAGLFINVVPVSGILLAFLVIGEPITHSLATGACLVLGGIYLTNRFRHTPPDPAVASVYGTPAKS